MTTPTEALKIARDALADMIRAGKQAKVDLTTGIRDGEPVHPVSASLTFPLATAINAIAAIDALAQQPSVPSAEPPFDMLAHLKRQAEFSAKTFGPGARVEGVTDHIAKELREVRESGGDLSEWVDVIILAFDGAWRSGASPAQIIDAMVAKQTKNEGRKWPDWRTAPANKAIEHDRSGEVGPTPPPATATKAQADATASVAELFSPHQQRAMGIIQSAAAGIDSMRAEVWNAAIEAAALVVQPVPHIDEERTCGEVAAAIRALKSGTAPQAAPVAPEPVKADGRLHADGYFTWARRDGYAMDKKLPCDFYLAAPAAPAPAVQPLSEEAMKWRKAVQEAYGWLWHTNNEPMAPVPMWSPEQAAYQARKCLRELLTTAERGEAINAIAAHMDKIAGITAAPTKETP